MASPSKIKILHLIDNLRPGGAQEILLDLVQCSTKKFEHIVASLYVSGEISSELETEGIVVESLSSSKWLSFFGRRKFNALLRKHKPDVINLHLEGATLLGLWWHNKYSDIKLVVTIHALRQQLPGWFYPLFSKLVNNSDRVVVEDKIAFKQVRETGFDQDKIIHIPIGTNYHKKIKKSGNAFAGIRKEFGIPADAPILLNIARMHPAKGQSELLNVFPEILKNWPECRLVIVGYGKEDLNLKTLSRDLGVQGNVIFPGLRRDLENFYIDANCFVMTALDEGMGVVIYQAMAFGVPVIAYEAGSVSEVVRHEKTGYLLPVGDRGELIRRIEQTLSLKQGDIDSICHFAQGLITNEFSSGVMAKKYESTYEKVLQ